MASPYRTLPVRRRLASRRMMAPGKLARPVTVQLTSAPPARLQKRTVIHCVQFLPACNQTWASYVRRAEYRMAEREAQLKSWMLGGLDGDAAAHSALLHALVPLLHSFFRRRLDGPNEDVEDLVQETLIAVHTRRASYDRARPFTAWLYAVARYRMIDHCRRRRLTVPLEYVDDILV